MRRRLLPGRRQRHREGCQLGVARTRGRRTGRRRSLQALARRPRLRQLTRSGGLVLVTAEFVDGTAGAIRLSGLAYIAAMQDQPVMRPFFPGIGHTPDKLCLGGVGCLAGGHAGAVADTENMRVQ